MCIFLLAAGLSLLNDTKNSAAKLGPVALYVCKSLAQASTWTNLLYQIYLPLYHLLLLGRRTRCFPVLG